MKYRVMSKGEVVKDFDTEKEALSLFEKEKAKIKTTRVTGDMKLNCNIHRCFHDEGKPCEIIEEFVK